MALSAMSYNHTTNSSMLHDGLHTCAHTHAHLDRSPHHQNITYEKAIIETLSGVTSLTWNRPVNIIRYREELIICMGGGAMCQVAEMDNRLGTLYLFSFEKKPSAMSGTVRK